MSINNHGKNTTYRQTDRQTNVCPSVRHVPNKRWRMRDARTWLLNIHVSVRKKLCHVTRICTNNAKVLFCFRLVSGDRLSPKQRHSWVTFLERWTSLVEGWSVDCCPTASGSQGWIQGRDRGARAPTAPSNFYRHNTTSSCAILQVCGHYGNVPFKRLALLDLYYFAVLVRQQNYLLSERRCPRISWTRASFCKSIATTSQNRLPLWTISLALEHADCVLYFKTKIAGNKTMSEWDDEIIIIYSYNISLYGLDFLSVSGFSTSWRNILRTSWGFAPDPHRGSPTGALPLDPAEGLASPRLPATAPPKPKSQIRPLWQRKWVVADVS